MSPPLGPWRRRTPSDEDRGHGDVRNRLRTRWFRWFLLYPRACVAAAGYALIAVFAIGFGAAAAIGVSISSALTVGMLAAGPLFVAVIWDRVTGIKAFGVEVTLTEVTPPIAGDHADVASALSQSLGQGLSGSAVGSTGDDLSAPFTELIENEAKLLRIDLRDDNYWWSTRMFLVAALAQDYTQVEALVFVRSGNAQNFVGIAAPRDVRRRLAKNFPPNNYESAYRKARAAATVDPKDPSSAVITILKNWQSAVDQTLGEEGYIADIVSSSKLRQWMRGDLDTQSVPAGPLTAQKQYRIIAHDRRYVALTNGMRLEEIVDRDELVVAAQLERRVSTGS